jgi:hypothetical protein
MITHFSLKRLTSYVAAVLMAGCGGGSGHGGGNGSSMTPPPSAPPPAATVNFNATVRALATDPESPSGATSKNPVDVNTPVWVFENEDDTAFDDLF